MTLYRSTTYGNGTYRVSLPGCYRSKVADPPTKMGKSEIVLQYKDRECSYKYWGNQLQKNPGKIVIRLGKSNYNDKEIIPQKFKISSFKDREIFS